MKANHSIKSYNAGLMLLSITLLCGCLNKEESPGCINGQEFQAFKKRMDAFSAISPQAECYQLQQAARDVMSKTAHCSDFWEIEANAKPWLSIDCSLWKGIDDY